MLCKHGERNIQPGESNDLHFSTWTLIQRNVSLNPSVFSSYETGQFQVEHQADIIFWERTSEEKLKETFENAKEIWTETSAQAFQNIKIKLQQHWNQNRRKITRIVSIGSGSMQAELDPPGPLVNDPSSSQVVDDSDVEQKQALSRAQTRRRIRGAAHIALVFGIQEELKNIQDGEQGSRELIWTGY